jgi:hypothetical protein
LKILPVTHFKDPKAAILALKMLTGSRLRFCKIIPEAACDKLVLALRQSALDQIEQTQRRKFEDGFSKHFQKLVINFKEAAKMLVIVYRVVISF